MLWLNVTLSCWKPVSFLLPPSLKECPRLLSPTISCRLAAATKPSCRRLRFFTSLKDEKSEELFPLSFTFITVNWVSVLLLKHLMQLLLYHFSSCLLTGWQLTIVPHWLHSAVEWRLQIWWRCCPVHFEDSRPEPCICPETNTGGKAAVRTTTTSNTKWTSCSESFTPLGCFSSTRVKLIHVWHIKVWIHV